MDISVGYKFACFFKIVHAVGSQPCKGSCVFRARPDLSSDIAAQVNNIRGPLFIDVVCDKRDLSAIRQRRKNVFGVRPVRTGASCAPSSVIMLAKAEEITSLFMDKFT